MKTKEKIKNYKETIDILHRDIDELKIIGVMDLREELDRAKFMIERLIDAGVDMERRVSKLEEIEKWKQ